MTQFLTTAAVAAAGLAFGQSYTIQTVAGSGATGVLGGGLAGDDGPATSALLRGPQGVAIGPGGSFFIADTGNGRVRRVTGGGTIDTFPNTTAVRAPRGIVGALDGSIVVMDEERGLLLGFIPTGTWGVLAGGGNPFGQTEAQRARLALLYGPGMFGTNEFLLFPAADGIQRLTFPDARLGVLIGETGTVRTQRLFLDVGGIAVSRTGDIFFTNTSASGQGEIVAVSAAGALTSIPLTDLGLNSNPRGIVIDNHGTLIVALTGQHRVVRITLAGTVETVAGTGVAGFSGDGGPGASAQLSGPTALALAESGDIYVADTGNHRIRVLRGGAPGATPVLPARISAVADAASFENKPISPGKLVSIFGTNLAQQTQGLQVVQGRATTNVAGVRVLFDGIPAPLVAVSPGQINAITPYGVSGRSETRVEVEFAGVRSPAVAVPVIPAAPSIFTANGTGRGPGAILNQDSQLNTASNAAARQSAIAIFATGEGDTDPPGVDGLVINAPNLPRPRLPVRVRIGGQEAQVLYAGAAPGFVSGVIQVNAMVPAGVPVGQQPVSLEVGGVLSQAGVTVWIR